MTSVRLVPDEPDLAWAPCACLEREISGELGAENRIEAATVARAKGWR